MVILAGACGSESAAHLANSAIPATVTSTPPNLYPAPTPATTVETQPPAISTATSLSSATPGSLPSPTTTTRGEATVPTPPAPAEAPPANVPADVTLTDADNGRTVIARNGIHVTANLGSTYWMFRGTTEPSVLRQEGEVTYLRGPGCLPGSGCGTATVVFLVVGAGRADVVAERTSCGEGRTCTGGDGSFRVTVIVSN